MAKEQDYVLLSERGFSPREAAMIATIADLTVTHVGIVADIFQVELNKAKEFGEWEITRNGGS